MSSVEAYRDRLAALQGSWDTLSLLSHLAADSSDMSSTRHAFESLATDLVESLTTETHKKSLLALKARSQIAIDILVRNLFERTADIGFLSADQDFREYLRDMRELRDESRAVRRKAALHDRLRAYVAKYSVYRDIALLGADGTILLKLDDDSAVGHSADPLIRETLETRAPYVETYRRVDFFPREERSLVYSHRVGDGGRDTGILCLCFDLTDEVERIFSKLRAANDWTIYAFVDRTGAVIASSDQWQLPRGAKVPLALDEGGSTIRFAGREYLAITRSTPGYQGYAGPGWYGHAMIPLEHAFDEDGEASSSELSEVILEALATSELLFSAELRRIPEQARHIQEELNRSVWNGNVRLASRSESGSAFAKALLREIGNAGKRTQETFEHSIADLQRTVASTICQGAHALAKLAVDILDRNLYERANDCRWWALNATLQQHLAGVARDPQHAGEVLRHINSLYTVYYGIVLFDTEGRIQAASNPAHSQWIGKRCNDAWIAETLALRDPQAFAVSSFAPSELYGNRSTLIFGAALGVTTGRAVGGIGIIFDAEPQLAAMLNDALPRSASGAISEGCVGLYIDPAQRVISATSLFQPGEIADLPADLVLGRKDRGNRVIEYRGRYFAASACDCSGYREYTGMGAIGVILIPLGSCPKELRAPTKISSCLSKRTTHHEQTVEIATFFCAGQWLGLLRDHIVEAIDSASMRPLPGKPKWHAGIVLYRGDPIPVIDLARLASSPSPATRREIIIVQAHERRIGLLIDELASIPEVPVTSLLPLSESATRNAVRIVDRAVRPDSPEDPVLLIVNIDHVVLATKNDHAHV